MRRVVGLTSLIALVVVAAATVGRTSPPAATAAGPATCRGAVDTLNLVNSGQLTIGTDNPAYPPWFGGTPPKGSKRSEEHTSELQSHSDLVCRLLLEKKKACHAGQGWAEARRRLPRPCAWRPG